MQFVHEKQYYCDCKGNPEPLPPTEHLPLLHDPEQQRVPERLQELPNGTQTGVGVRYTVGRAVGFTTMGVGVRVGIEVALGGVVGNLVGIEVRVGAVVGTFGGIGVEVTV